MDTTRRLVAAAVVAIALGPPLVATASEDERPRIGLYIKNYPNVRSEDLARARAEVERIFAHAGVTVTWAQADEPDRITILLLSITRDSHEDAAGCALGVALAPRSTVYVFVNRIARATRERPVDVPVVVGRVIAHEVGHVLMPSSQHSSFGIMRADLDFGYTNPSGFSDDEARRIRSRLRGHADQ